MEPIGNAMQWNENHNSFRASANNADVDADADSLCIHIVWVVRLQSILLHLKSITYYRSLAWYSMDLN